ncbi:hypothetical protein KJ940_19645, partial [Myxococcota bacterium]|nr:hypothetical protein [Myxococcota bacterium]
TLERFAWQRRQATAPLAAVILDEGALQSVWSLTLHAPAPPKALAPCLRGPLTATPRVIVALKAPIAQNAAWLAARPEAHSRLDGRPLAEIEARLAAHAPLFDRLVEQAARAGAQIITLDAATPLEAQLQSLRAALALPPGPIGVAVQAAAR